MFRTLFRSKRTVRVPVEDAGLDVRRVKIIRRAMSKPSNLITTFFVAYFFFRMLESALFTSDDPQSKDTKEQLEKWKKDQGISTSQSQTTDHWKKAHQEFQEKEKTRRWKGSAVDGKTSTQSSSPEIQDIENRLSQRGMITAITLPVWIRERKCPLYTPSDPEYKEYVKLQSDKKKMMDLKKQVGDWAISRLKNPVHAASLAYIGFKGQVTIVLELVPQVRPPPLHEVPCLIIFRDGIGWGWRVLPPHIGNKMDSLMRPGIAFGAAKAAFSAFFSTSYTIAKAKFASGSPTVVTFGKPAPPSPNSAMTDKEIERDNVIPPLSQWNSKSQSIQELLRAVHNGQTFQERHDNMIKHVPFSAAIQIAAATYKRKQLLGMTADQQRRTRGIMVIRGTIVCHGERGKYKLGVLSVYLPSEDKFIGSLVVNSAYVIKDYSLWDKQQEMKKKSNIGTQQSRPAVGSKDDDSTPTKSSTTSPDEKPEEK